MKMQWGIRIPTRDRAELSAILYLPATRERAEPAIVTMTPYVAQSCHDAGVFFASNGYPFLAVDVRGRGNSDGSFHPMHEAKDGHDVVEWVARQSYCNGQVAMWGGSYSGYAQWAAAKEFPPHLATIVPVAAPHRGVDSPLRDNTFAPYLMQWLTLLAGRTSQEKIFADRQFWSQRFRAWFEAGIPFRELDTFLGNPSPLFQEWVSHPQRDVYWEAYGPRAEDYPQITIPILTITGMYDSNQLGALEYYREHIRNAPASQQAHHYLVIGPWDHAGTRVPQMQFGGLRLGPASLLDLRALHLEWYAWTMQGGSRPHFLQKRVAYYVSGAEEWRHADSLGEITTRSQVLYLQSGTLATAAPRTSDVDSYVYDPRDAGTAELESTVDPDSLVDQRMVHAAIGKQLVYHSAPFQTDCEIGGFFRLTAWIGIDRPDTDFRVSIHQIDAAGGSLLLATATLRARYRESLYEERLIRTTQPLRYQFTRFTFVSRLLRKGSRLRLIIGPIHSIYAQRNYGSGGVVADESIADAQPVTVRLFHSAAYPSALHVPIGREAA
jgi:putative CocE/NonD family hydrolase